MRFEQKLLRTLLIASGDLRTLLIAFLARNRPKEVQALLSKHCQLTGYPGFFKFSMPVQLQQAHGELAHVRRMKMDELKQKECTAQQWLIVILVEH